MNDDLEGGSRVRPCATASSRGRCSCIAVIAAIASDKPEARSSLTRSSKAIEVTLLSGNPEPVAVPTDSGRPHEIYRCPSCRVGVWSVYGDVRKLLFVRVGTLDDPGALTPDVHIYVRSKLPWIALPEGTPSFDAYYDSRKLWPSTSLERRRALFGKPA